MARFSLPTINLKGSKRDDLPEGAIGRVIEADGKTIIATVEPKIKVRRHYFIQVASSASDSPSGEVYLLIAQIENVVGKGVKIGVQTTEGSLSFIVSAKVVE